MSITVGNNFSGDINVADRVFHGFSFNPVTGKLIINALDGDTPVRFPDDNIFDNTSYSQWFWTNETITYYWDTTKGGHLLMRII
jgi:hypothetical protein